MTLPHPFSGLEAKAKKPITEDLADKKYKENIESLSSQIDAISSVSGGGSSDTGEFGEIKLGGKTNIGKHWKKRFSPNESQLKQDKNNIGGFDPEGKDLENHIEFFIQSNESGFSEAPNALAYKGTTLRILDDSKYSFKIKKGVNFFSLGYIVATSTTDGMEVFIDGQTPSSLGLLDENGLAANDVINTASPVTRYGESSFFYGLDGEEHIITIENKGVSTSELFLEYIEVGYVSEEYTTDSTLSVSKGVANVRGADVAFIDTNITFGKDNKNGHTGAVIVDSSDGLVKALDGESPAMTQVKPEVNLTFSGTVEELPVKNSWYFPETSEGGICLMSTPYGAHYFFSYNENSMSTIQSHEFRGILWQSKPSEDYTPMNNFTEAGAGELTGDLNINYWGTAPIEITSSNNKIDFQITKNGVSSIHTATVPVGRYAVDLVRIGDAVNKAMQASKSINGRYVLEYNKETQKYHWFCEDSQVSEMQLLFNSGVNALNSIAEVLGFTGSDQTGDVGYNSTDPKQHLSSRVFQKTEYLPAGSPRIKRNYAPIALEYDQQKHLQEKLGHSNIYTVAGEGFVQVFPNENSSGLRLDFVQSELGIMVAVKIDDCSDWIFLTQSDFGTSSPEGRIVSGFISYPKGTRKIDVVSLNQTKYEITDNAQVMIFAGAQEYITKPSFEKLTLTQAIVETVNVRALNLIAHYYGSNGGNLYTPQASNDQINNIVETGSWSGFSGTTSTFGAAYRFAQTVGDYVDYEIVLTGDGGGFDILSLTDTSYARKVGIFVSQSAINESTDRISTQALDITNPSTWIDVNFGHVRGLTAGTYFVRIKYENPISGSFLAISGFRVIDTVATEENKNTVADLSNNGIANATPLNVFKYSGTFDDIDKIPSRLNRTGYKNGQVSNVNLSIGGSTGFTVSDEDNFLFQNHKYTWGLTSMFSNTDNWKYSFLGENCFMEMGYFQNTELNHVGFIDGRQFSSVGNSRTQTKGGLSPNSTRVSSEVMFQKEFFISCSFDSGSTLLVTDTRGIKQGSRVRVFDGTNTGYSNVSSIVADTSVTLDNIPSGIVAANIVKLDFSGFHNISATKSTTNVSYLLSMGHTPLTIFPSNYLHNYNTDKVLETVTVVFRGVINNDDLYYPTHSDGVDGTWFTSSVEIISKSEANFYEITTDLRDIQVSSGNLDIKITSTREVPIRN